MWRVSSSDSRICPNLCRWSRSSAQWRAGARAIGRRIPRIAGSRWRARATCRAGYPATCRSALVCIGRIDHRRAILPGAGAAAPDQDGLQYRAEGLRRIRRTHREEASVQTNIRCKVFGDVVSNLRMFLQPGLYDQAPPGRTLREQILCVAVMVALLGVIVK